MKNNHKKRKPSPQSPEINNTEKNGEEQYEHVMVPSSWLKGSSGHVYMEDITIYYSYN